MSLDPRTPVLVGVGQINHREGLAPEPIELLAEAARLAAQDAGSQRLLAGVGSIRLVKIATRRYSDSPALLAEILGAAPSHRLMTHEGGNFPQALLNRTAADILRGDLDSALIGGAECVRTRAAYKTRGESAPWTVQPDDRAPSEMIGSDESFFHPSETRLGLDKAPPAYALFETALAHRQRWSAPEHRKRLGELWAGFAGVAARNPHAAIRRRYRPDELTTVGPRNRMVSYPYPKLLCANNSVDQAAALLVCSVQRATDLGIPRDRWVFPWSGAQGNEPPMSRRYDLAASPAIRIAGRRASLLAGITVDDIEHVDIYSCFPSAVQIAANELELCVGRELTVTGGLTFAGGPWSNYTTHAIATMTTLLRESPNAIGMCTANGGVLTKHAIGVYSASPPRTAFRSTDVQDEIDREPARRITPEVEGPATLEAFTVRVDRDGQPTEAYMSALRADGRRVWTSSRRADLITELIDDDRAERHLRIGDDGTVELEP